MNRGIAASLADLTYSEVEALLADPRTRVALIPVGSTEAHGPHLPLATDTILAEEMARRASELLAADNHVCVRFPASSYAVTRWAASFAGSTSLSPTTAVAGVLETCIAAHEMGFTHVVLVNAHLEPDHLASLREVVRLFAEQTGSFLLFPDKTRRVHAETLGEEFRSGSCHAGRYETSLVLAVRPDLVRMDIAKALPRLDIPLHEHIRAGAKNFVECGIDRAYCGDPAAATAEEGHALYDILAQMIRAAVETSLKPA